MNEKLYCELTLLSIDDDDDDDDDDDEEEEESFFFRPLSLFSLSFSLSFLLFSLLFFSLQYLLHCSTCVYMKKLEGG